MPRTPDPNIPAGELDRRVTLLQPVTNEYGDEIQGWEPVTNVWAAIDAEGGGEATEADRTVETVPTVIVIRYRADVNARWRVQDREHVYQIRAVSDIARRRTSMVLTCVEVE